MRQFVGTFQHEDREKLILTTPTEMQSQVTVAGDRVTFHTVEEGVTAESLSARLRSAFGIVLALREANGEGQPVVGR
jgi:hypothetical protein